MIGLSKLFHRHRPEVRESYTDLAVSRLVAAAAGVGDGSALAAIETAARLWEAGSPLQASNRPPLRSRRSRLPYLTPWAVRFAVPVSRCM